MNAIFVPARDSLQGRGWIVASVVSVGTLILIALLAVTTSCLVAGAMPTNEWRSTFALSRSASTPSGPATGGIAISLSTRDPRVSLSGKLPLTIEVRNVSSSQQLVRFPWAPCSYVFRITNVSTLEKREFQAEGCDLYNISPTVIDPEISAFLTFPFPVGEAFGEPGAYELKVDKLFRYRGAGLQFNLVSISSNRLAIQVLP